MARRTLARYRKARGPHLRSPLVPHDVARQVCLEATDHSVVRCSAVDFFQLPKSRESQPQAARLAEQFVSENRRLCNALDVTLERDYDGMDVSLMMQTGSRVGAVPLLSPATAKPDYGLVVQPRFPWAGLGPMLAEMGWRIAPTLLRFPLLRRSERRVPAWVMSLAVLARLKPLLDSLERRFEVVKESRNAPRGAVDWTAYATRSLPSARFLSVPCTFPDLRDDRLLKGAVRYTLEQHLRSLESLKEHGSFVHQLIEMGQELLQRVRMVPAHLPSSGSMIAWLQRPLRVEHFIEGIQAIEWTVEQRGLAGLSDLEGIPWTMPMEAFFEAWVETVFQIVARHSGGLLKLGRKRETVHPITWEPPYLGSQKSLVPDMTLEWADTTLIVDAKYKRHWEELEQHPWSRAEEALREQHRNDLFQVLAYANLAKTPRVVACLAYPCSTELWKSLVERGRFIHQAELAIGTRSLHLWLTAIPMLSPAERAARPLTERLLLVLRNASGKGIEAWR